jgi:tRNA (guanine-N7-)-methyltransferase
MARSLKYEIPGDDPRLPMSLVAEQGWAACFREKDACASEAGADAGPGGESGVGDFDRMVLEIGFGRGEFMLDMASRAPSTAFVGIEISFKRTLKMARKVARARLRNVRLLEGRAEVALRQLFEPGRLAEIWINFSDPWPKARHARRRLIQPTLIADAARRLRPGGLLHVATDDVPYAHQIDEVLAGEPSLRNLHAPLPFLPEASGRMTTGYESQWRAEGRPLHFFTYVRREDGDVGGAGA